MTTRQTVALNDLSTLLPDWCRHLRAHNLSPRTIASYRQTGEAFRDYLAAQGCPARPTQ